jgi:hypothetical protein
MTLAQAVMEMAMRVADARADLHVDARDPDPTMFHLAAIAYRRRVLALNRLVTALDRKGDQR